MKPRKLVVSFQSKIFITLSKAAVTGALALGCGSLHAADQTYDPLNLSNVWDLAATNWDGSTVVWTNGNNAIFGGTGESVSVDDAITVGDITFNSGGYTLADGVLGSLGLANANNTFTVTNLADTAAIAETINGVGKSITKSGAGLLTLSGPNTYDGGTTIKAGTLLIGVSDTSATVGALGGSSRVVLLGDTVGSANANLLINGAFTLGNAISVQTGSTANTLSLGGSTAAASIFSGAITLGTNGATPARDVSLIALAGGSVDFSGVLNEGTSNTTTANITVGDATHTGTVKLSNVANAYSGITTIKSGATLEVVKLAAGGSNSSIGNSGSSAAAGSVATDLVISGGTLKYSGAGDSTNRLFTYDANGASIDASAVANAALTFSGTGSLAASGTGNRTLTLTGASTGANTMTSIIVNPSAGVTSLVKSGAGSWVLGGANTYTGGTAITAGSLSTGIAGGLGTGPLSIGSGATLNLTTGNISYTFGTLSGSGTIALSGGTGGNTHKFNSGNVMSGNSTGFTGSLNLNTPAKFQLDNPLAPSATINVLSNSTLYVANGVTSPTPVTLNGGDTGESFGQIRVEGGGTISGNVTLAGNITGSGDGFFGANNTIGTISGNISDIGGAHPVNKVGAGILVLSGTNTYAGSTTVSAATLQLAKQVSLYNNTPASWTDTNIIVNSGTTLTLNVGGTGEFTTGNIDTLKALGTATGGFRTGSNLGFDTTNAGGSFTYASNIANPSGTATSLGLVKTGTGELVLSGNLTNTGNILVNAGVLTLSGNNNNGLTATTTVGSFTNLSTTFFGTLQLQANSANTAAFTAPSTALGTAATKLSLNNGSTLQLRSDTTTAFAGGDTLGGVGSATINLDVNNLIAGVANGNTNAGVTGRTLTFASGGFNTFATTLNITGGNGYTLSLGTITDTGAASTVTLAPNSANLTIAGFTTASATLVHTLALAGNMATGTNTVTGAVALGTAATVNLTKSGNSTWALAGTNSYNGTTAVNGGTLKLDYSATNTTKLADAAALTLGGGTLELAGGSHTEVVASTTLTAGTTSAVTRTGVSASVLNMNLITAGVGSLVNFGASSIATTDNTNTNGILGPWATVTNAGSTNWAINSTNAADGLITAYSAYTNINRLGASTLPNTTAANVQIVNGGTLGNIGLTNGLLTQIFTLKMDASDGAAVIDPTANTDLLNIGGDTGGGILQTATSGGLTIGTTAGDGVLTTGGTFNATVATLNVINESATNALTINSNLSNNNTDVVSLSKSGAGVLVLNAANGYTGSTFVNGGTIRAGSSTALGAGGIFGTSGALTMAGGTTLDMNGNNLTVAALTGNISAVVTDNATGSGTSTLRVVDSNAGAMANLFTDGATRVVGVSTANQHSNTSVLSNVGNTFSGGLTLLNGIGTGTSANGTRLNPINGTIGTPGAIVSGPYGRGAITLGLASTDRVGIIFSSGNITIVNALVINTNRGTDIAGLRVDTTGNVISGAIQANLADLLITGNAGSIGAISLTGPISSGSLATGLTLFDGTLSTGNVTVTLANTGTANSYTGDTNISNRNILKLGAANQIPDGSGKGNMIVTGQFQLAGFSETIDGLSGSGVVDGLSGVPTLTVGNNNGTYNFSGTLQNSAGNLALIKTGNGTQMLSGFNTYGGGTTVSGGTLIGTRASALGINGGLNVAGSATFSYQPTAAGILSLGTGVLTLANGSTIGTAVGGTAGQSAIASSSAASVAGTIAVNVSGIPGVAVNTGTHNLITAASGLNGGTFTLGNIYNATNFTVGSFTQTDTAVTLGITSATALTTEYWKGGLAGGAGVWALSNGTSASNWASDIGGTATSLTPGTLADVFISSTSATNQGAMTLGANMSLKSLTVTDTNAVTLNADGNTLTLGIGGLTVNSGAGATTISAPVTLGGVQTWTNNSANALTVNGAIASGFLHTITGSGTGGTTLGAISGSGALTKTGTGTVTFAGADTRTGALTIAGGTAVVPTGGSITSGIAQAGGQIIIGSAAATNAVMNVTGGSVSTTRLGGQSILVGQGTSNGALRISAGSVSTAGTSGEIAIGSGAGGYGSITVSGTGTLNSNSYLVIGSTGDKAVLNQTGGIINVNTNFMTIAAGSGGTSTAVANLSGGTFNALYNGIVVGESGTGTLNVSGTSVVNVLGGVRIQGVNGIANLLTGGTIIANTVSKPSGTGTFNFNGGTLKANTNGATLLGGMNTSNIYGNGAIIDSNGYTVTVSQALLAPAGSGISTSTVTVDSGSGYIGAPLVTIGGTITGATATANMVDDGTGNGTFKVGTVTITSPGINASGAITYAFSGGGFSSAATGGNFTTAANSTAGGLTKEGAGALTVSSNGSSFTGNVTVNAGTLAVTTAAAGTGLTSALGNLLTVGKTITVNNGGTLSFNINNAINNGTTPGAALQINSGGILTNNNFNGIGNITLNGGTMTSMNGALNTATFQAWSLGGSVTVGGTSASTITSLSTTTGGVHLAAAGTTFTVDDATSSANVDLIVSAPLANTSSALAAAGFTKAGLGTMSLSGFSTFSGNVNIDLGTLIADRDNNNFNPTSGALGNMQNGRNITVGTAGGSVANLKLAQGDVFGGATSTIVSTLFINSGGTVTNNGNNFNMLGPVVLNGGILTSTGGAALGFQSYSLGGSITSGGAAVSTISGTGSFNGYHLAANTLFTVAEAVAGSDLDVSAPLINRNTSQGGATSPGGLTKAGAGTMTLSAANTYSGPTTISGGSLALAAAGSILNSSGVALNSGNFNVSAVTGGYTLGATQSLTGTGTVTGDLSISGNLAIGASPGTIDFSGNLGLNTGSTSSFEFTSASFTLGTFDRANGTGTVTFGGTLNLLFDGGTAYADNSTVQIFNFTTGYAGLFSAVNPTGLAPGQSASFDAATGFVTVIPEPAVGILGGLGLLLAFRRRREPA